MVTCAALLVKLKASGTGSAKLEPVRDHMRAYPQCTAEDALAVLRNHTSELTVLKAESIVKTGEYVVPVVAANRSIEDELYEAEQKAIAVVVPPEHKPFEHVELKAKK